MKKNKKLYIVFNILIIIFALSVVNKTLQNDTFFSIPIGNDVLQNGITTEEKLTWHKGLKFEHSGIFSSVIAMIYNIANFNGIYIFTLIMTVFIGLTLFNVLLKRKINLIISFLTTITALYFSKDAFTARAQMASYLMFIIELYLIEKLLVTQKKRYCIELMIISILIANFHSSVWPMYFVFFLPYIAEYLFRKLKMDITMDKLRTDSFDIKLLLITLFISTFSGLCTPIGTTPYTDMVNVMKGISKNFINELEPIKIIENNGMLISLGMYWIAMAFRETKIKVSDFFLFLGLFLMGLMAKRNTIFLYLIGSVSFARMVNNIENLEKELEKVAQKLNNSNCYITVFSFIIIVIAIVNYIDKINQNFIDETSYPVAATEYILENLDIGNMRIFNHFNFGSYLEFMGVPAFIDSRSGIYCEEFNDTSILQDWFDVAYGRCNYKIIFEKYNITHVLLYKEETINVYISDDKDYCKLYEDENFVLYEKNEI